MARPSAELKSVLLLLQQILSLFEKAPHGHGVDEKFFSVFSWLRHGAVDLNIFFSQAR